MSLEGIGALFGDAVEPFTGGGIEEIKSNRANEGDKEGESQQVEILRI